MAMTRRAALAGSAAMLASGKAASQAASAATAASGAEAEIDVVTETALPPLPAELRQFAGQPAYNDFSKSVQAGSAQFTDAQAEVAKAILLKAPFDVPPVRVAEYFLAVAEGKVKKDWAPYAAEWPVVANPLIVALFKATRTIPDGDTTAWCAAFANWCIAQGNAKEPLGDGPISPAALALTTRSAASGSFRCWAPSASPKIGDLAVFVKPGTEGIACGGQGHVGFAYGDAPAGLVRVLGGNQIMKGTGGAITIARYPVKGRVNFLGFRTAAVLRT